MASNRDEWQDEFEKLGGRAVYEAVHGRTLAVWPEDKRRFATEWLKDQEKHRRQSDALHERLAKRTLCAAIVAAVAGIIGAVASIASLFWR